jgi:hypothetical protein
MKHRNSHFAVGYWSLIRRGRPAPDQADVDPKALKRLLPFVFLLDARHSSYVYRLAGTTLCERYGGELRGQDFLWHWDHDSRTKLPAVLRQSLAESVPLCLSSVGTTHERSMVELETILMPVTFKGQLRERFLGVCQVLTDPRPLLGSSISIENLVGSELVREGECSESEPPSALPATPVRRLSSSRTSRGAHLSLVVSQLKPASDRDQSRFDGNDALAALMARCQGDEVQGGRVKASDR